MDLLGAAALASQCHCMIECARGFTEGPEHTPHVEDCRGCQSGPSVRVSSADACMAAWIETTHLATCGPGDGPWSHRVSPDRSLSLKAASDAVAAAVRACLEVRGRTSDVANARWMSSSSEPRSRSPPLGFVLVSLVLRTTPAARRQLRSTTFEPLPAPTSWSSDG